MYHTAEGRRALTGDEKELFVAALQDLVSDLDQDIEPDTGIEVFDGLEFGQKMVVLGDVARALLDAETPTPEPTALIEGTIAAIYCHLKGCVALEIDLEEDSTWRQLIREIDSQRAPVADSEDIEAWWSFIENEVLDRILTDRDFDMDDLFVDEDPAKSRSLREQLGIDDGYFTAIAPDPTEEEVRESRQQLIDIAESCLRALSYGEGR